MDKGRNWIIDAVFANVKKDDVDLYVEEMLKDQYNEFKSKEEVDACLGESVDNFLEKLSYQEMDVIRDYTGNSFRFVNAIMREAWDYRINGELTDDKKREYEELGRRLEQSLAKAGDLPVGFKVFRGVSLPFFYPYNITSLKDLVYLKNEYMCDFGFTSTSLLRDNSFFAKPPLWGMPNIEIECLVPESSDDGVYLRDSNLSVSSGQCEFLVTSTSLFKVLDVLVDEENNKASLKVMLVPKKVWNLHDYELLHGNLER